MGNREKRRARSKLVKKLARLQRQRQVSTGPGDPSGVPAASGPTFGWHYPGPAELAMGGPLVLAELSLPLSLRAALGKAGRPIPPPVVGFMLVDTGATKTNIAEEAAKALNLRPIGQSVGFGAGGQHVHNDYQVHLAIRIRDAQGKETLIESEQQAAAVPDLAKHSAGLGIRVASAPVSFIGLLGRDFLRHTTFTYRGTLGSFEIRVHLDTLGKAPAAPATIQVPPPGEPIAEPGGQGPESGAEASGQPVDEPPPADEKGTSDTDRS